MKAEGVTSYKRYLAVVCQAPAISCRLITDNSLRPRAACLASAATMSQLFILQTASPLPLPPEF